MGKNNRLINSMKMLAEQNQANNLAKASDEVVPVIYAAVALALHNACGFGYRRINEVFVESQRIWEEFADTPDEMIKLCKEQTGIDIMLSKAD